MRFQISACWERSRGAVSWVDYCSCPLGRYAIIVLIIMIQLILNIIKGFITPAGIVWWVVLLVKGMLICALKANF